MNSYKNSVPWTVIFSLLVASAFPPSVWASDYPRGDINGDGAIDVVDSEVIRDMILGRTADFSKQVEADFNVDGRVDVADLVNTLHYDGDWDKDGTPDALDAFPFDAERSVDTGGSVSPELQLIAPGEIYASIPEVQYLRVDADSNVQLPFEGATPSDSDGDGLENTIEDLGYEFTYPAAIVDLYNAAQHGPITVITDPLLPDSDRDGLNDKEERDYATDALNPDTDLDGVLDGCDSAPLNPAIRTLNAGCLENGELTWAQREANRAYQIARVETLATPAKGAKDGGGSRRGLGFQGPSAVGSGFESVQSDLFTGSFSYSIPIAVPPGRSGMQPNIDLMYRSSNSHSWLGIGWNLEVGRIERSTKNGPPKYTNPADASDPAPFDASINTSDGDPMTPLDNPDTYVHITSAGGTELVYTGTLDVDYNYCGMVGIETCGVYFSVVDSGSFTRYLYHPIGQFWEAQSKDGGRIFFGGNPNSNPFCGDTNSVQQHPTFGAFAWGLDEAWDVNGNVNKITYTYQHPAGTNNMYLDLIGYNYVGGQPKVTIEFDITARTGNESWASYRESYRSKMKVTSEYFLTSILQTVEDRDLVGGGLKPERVRRHQMQYHPLNPSAGRTISALSSVQEFGESDSITDSRPPITMNYSENAGLLGVTSQFAGPQSPVFHHRYEGDRGAIAADINGDALTDFWQRFESSTNLLNTGSDFANAPASFAEPIGSPYFSHSSGFLGTVGVDLNGDLLPDIWQRYKDIYGNEIDSRHLNTGTTFESTSKFAGVAGQPFFIYKGEFGNTGVNAVDINGDGLTDLWQRHGRTSTGYLNYRFLNTGEGFVSTSDFAAPTPEPVFYHESRGPNGTIPADINGDGLTDLWQRYSDGFEVRNIRMVNTGNDFASTTNFAGPTGNPLFHHETVGNFGTLAVDLNGDGLTDIWQRYSNGTDIFNARHLNTGIDFVDSSSFEGVNGESFFYHRYVGDMGARAADINGDGLVDFWQRYTDGTIFIHKRYLNSGPYPNLLTSIDNGRGGTVSVEYTPQTKPWMSLYDPDLARRVEPEASGVELNKHLPYVMQCVSKVTRTGERPKHLNPSDTADPVAGTTSESYTTLYRYSGAKFEDREFRGFGKVKEVDGQTGNFTITEFHQDYARKGQVKAVRSYLGDRRAYRIEGEIDGDFIAPVNEAATVAYPSDLISESYINYRVVIHPDDPNHAKSFTDTSEKLGLGTDFPKGMSLVTPRATLTRTFEYLNAAGDGADYDQPPTSVVVTAQEHLYSGRGNLLQSIDYGRVDLLDSPTLDDPMIDQTFTSEEASANADGRITRATEYVTQRNGSWVDLPTKTNLSGFYFKDDELMLEEEILQASETGYDALHRPLTVTQSLDTDSDPIITYQYDVYGNVTRVTDPRQNQTNISYDLLYHAFPKTVINAAGHVDEYVVDPGFGVLLSHSAPNGKTRTARYDGLGRVTQLLNSSGDVLISYDYEFWGERDGVTVPTRLRTTTHTPTGDVWREQHYDGLARPYQTLAVGQRGPTDPIRTVSYFNDRGAAWKTSQPHWLSDALNNPESIQYTYSFMESDNTADLNVDVKVWANRGQERLKEQRTKLNIFDLARSFTVYESPLSVKTVRNRGDLNIERREIRDAFGNLVGVWEPDDTGSVGTANAPTGQFTRFGFDALGRMQYVRRHINRSVDDPRDPITRIEYDMLGRRTRLDDPDTGISISRYDLTGNLIQTTDARGVTVQHLYDALNRVTWTVFPDLVTGAIKEHRFTYDVGAGTNLVGQLARVVSPDCTTQYAYDDEGRIVSIRRTIAGTTYETTSEWDYAGRETKRTYPDGMSLEYAYDPHTQALDRVIDPDPVTGRVYLADRTTDHFGMESEFVLGNGPGGIGVTRGYERDFTGRAYRMLTTQVPGGTTLSDLQYTFDLTSNVRRIRELAGPTPRGDMNYTYDSLDRLLKGYGTTMSGESAGAINTPRFSYAYDALGRITANTRFLNSAYPDASVKYAYEATSVDPGPTHAVREIQLHDPTNGLLVAHTFDYDPAGNLITSTNNAGAASENALDRQFTWDALGRLTSATTPQEQAVFAYDYTTRRVRKSDAAGNFVVYVGDIVEVSAQGMTKHIFAGSKRIATIKPTGETLFYMTDHLNSSALIADVNGNIVHRMDYEPYGAALSNARSSNPEQLRHTYTGQEHDSETGLMYYNARYYDPMVGMFISADRFVANSERSADFHRFMYVYNNPIGYVDPSGHAGMFFGDAWYGNYVGPGTDISAAPPSRSVTDDIARNHDQRYAHHHISFLAAHRLKETDSNHRSSRFNLRWQQAKADALWVGDFVQRLDPTYRSGNGNYWSQIAENPWRGIRDLHVGAAATVVIGLQSYNALVTARLAVIPDAVEALFGSRTAGNIAAAAIDKIAQSLAVGAVAEAIGFSIFGWSPGATSPDDAVLSAVKSGTGKFLWHSTQGTQIRHSVENVYHNSSTVGKIRDSVSKHVPGLDRAVKSGEKLLKKLF